MKLKLTVEYDGTRYVGWQVQQNGPSVQAALEAALARIAGAPVDTIAAGRTDAGVHAAGQVVSFTPPREVPLKAWRLGVNSILPDDVAVVAAEEVDDAFDARRSASGKRYRYRLWNGGTRSPLRARTAWEVFRPLDVGAMREASAQLVGAHDFSAFRAAGCDARTTVRKVRACALSGASGDEIILEIEATAFLRHMVRNVVGTLVEVGHGKRSAGSVGDVLRSRDRALAGPTAPPHGLCLVEVSYGRR